MKLTIYSGAEIREKRKKLGLTQSEFWSRFQVTQSGSSRYETGRDIPEPIQLLLNIALGTDLKAASILKELREVRKPEK